MNSELKAVKEFYTGCGIQDQLQDSPTPFIEQRIKDLRIRLIAEEFEELKTGIKEENIVEIADALADLLYVIHGTTLAFGLQNHMRKIYEEVHFSNMSKMVGGVKIDEGGKMLKGPLYFRPRISEILGSPYNEGI